MSSGVYNMLSQILLAGSDLMWGSVPVPAVRQEKRPTSPWAGEMGGQPEGSLCPQLALSWQMGMEPKGALTGPQLRPAGHSQ